MSARWESVDALRCWLLWCAHMAARGDEAERERLFRKTCTEHGVPV